jgi:PPP family 3-phenylpropionic acid transporter
MSASLRVSAFLVAIFIPAAATTGFHPLFLADRGLTAAELGEILAVAMIARMLAMPLWGLLADLLGRRREVLMVASALAALSGVSWFGAHAYWPLMLVTMAYGATASALMPMADAVALTLAREGRLEYGPVRGVGSIAFMITIACAGWMFDLWGSGTLPWLVAVPYAVSVLAARSLPATQGPGTATAVGGIALWRHRPFLLAIAASALIQGSHAGVYALGSLHWRTHGVHEGTIGLLWAEGVLSEIILFFLARPMAERLGPPGLIAVAATAAVLRWSVIGTTTAVPWLVAAQALHGATYGMTHLSAMLLLSRTIPPAKAAVAQTTHAAIGTVLPIGLLMWLTSAAYDGTGAVFYAMAALGVAAFPVAWLLARLPGLRPAA